MPFSSTKDSYTITYNDNVLYNLILYVSLYTYIFLISASNYIISGSSGFETAKACAVIEETPRSNENQISIEDNYDLPVSVKPGEVLLNHLDCSSPSAPVRVVMFSIF